MWPVHHDSIQTELLCLITVDLIFGNKINYLLDHGTSGEYQLPQRHCEQTTAKSYSNIFRLGAIEYIEEGLQNFTDYTGAKTQPNRV